MGQIFSSSNEDKATEYIPVYGDTKVTTDEIINKDGGIYKHAAQRPDQLNDKILEMCKQLKEES